MVPSRAAASFVGLILLVSTAAAQAPAYDKAREVFREGIKKPGLEDRLAAVRALVEAKDVRATEDFIAAIRVLEQAIPKKREEVERVGKENKEIFKPLDDYIEQEKKKGNEPKGVPAEIVNRVGPKADALQAKLKVLTDELTQLEATRGALHEGIGRLLTSAGPAASPKILEIASAAQKATSFGDKLVFIRIFAATRAPESRDALIEMARLSQDGQVRTAAVTALGDHQDASAISTLSEALKDEAWSVRSAAAQALALIPSVDSVPALIEAMGNNEGGMTDVIVTALEDVTGVTFFDNQSLWKDWFQKEGEGIKKSLADLESGEPMIRMAGMNALAEKGTLAGVRLMLRAEGLHPPLDAKSKVKRSAIFSPETRAAQKDEIDTRRAVIAKILQSRPKAIRDRAIPSLILEPRVHANELDDDATEERYVRAAAALRHPAILDMLRALAQRIPMGEKAESEERLRRAAIEGLGFQDRDEAVDAIAPVLRGDKTSKEAKVLCVQALERLKREASVRPLIEALLEKGAVADAAAKALKTLTNQEFGVDRGAWNTWWNDKGKETAGLPLRKTAEEKEEEAKQEERKGGTTFYGITTHSKRIVFVLDVSGSMEQDDAKTGSTGVSHGTRIAIAKKELAAAVTALPEDANFDIIVFADGVQLWKPKLVTATKEVKAEALKWIDGLKAVGATNIFDALERAFELAGRGAADKRYLLNVDTILFMSDGQANRGRLVRPSAIIAELARLNEHKKVVINTIGVGKEHDVELMKRIARLNGGVYVSR
jgi:HEAT repeat protein